MIAAGTFGSALFDVVALKLPCMYTGFSDTTVSPVTGSGFTGPLKIPPLVSLSARRNRTGRFMRAMPGFPLLVDVKKSHGRALALYSVDVQAASYTLQPTQFAGSSPYVSRVVLSGRLNSLTFSAPVAPPSSELFGAPSLFGGLTKSSKPTRLFRRLLSESRLRCGRLGDRRSRRCSRCCPTPRRRSCQSCRQTTAPGSPCRA